MSLNKKCSDLKTSVDSLASQIVDLWPKSSVIRSNLTTLQEKVRVLEATSRSDTHLPQQLQELDERGKCQCNIVVHGLSESSESTLSVHAVTDIKALNEAILLLYYYFICPFRPIPSSLDLIVSSLESLNL